MRSMVKGALPRGARTSTGCSSRYTHSPWPGWARRPRHAGNQFTDARTRSGQSVLGRTYGRPYSAAALSWVSFWRISGDRCFIWRSIAAREFGQTLSGCG